MAVQQINPWLAVRPQGDRLAQARALQRVHEAFHSGKDVTSSLRGVVAQSWARSGDAGVDPAGHLPPIRMDEREIEERWSLHPLYPVLPMLRDLLRDATSDSAHMLAICDADGVLLWIEGHHRVIEATHDMHFVCGADWSERGAGTNALGTAIAVDHPVQIFSAEHFNRIVHPWQCSGAPIHDPTTGEILGVVDLTGHLRTAHPHTLSLVTAAARMAEAYLHHDRRRDEEVRRAATLKRLDVRRPRSRTGVRLELFGRRPRIHLPRGRVLDLSGRHAEILAVLLLADHGLTAEELTLEVYGETGKPVTLRAELSRLRRDLEGVLRAKPYAFAVPATSDLQQAERHLAAGRLAQALALTGERLLPASDAARVVEARDRLEEGLRAAVLAARDADLLVSWCRGTPGQEDEAAVRALLTLLAPGDAREAAARAHLARLRRIFAEQPSGRARAG